MPLQLACSWVSNLAAIPLARMCLDWLQLSLFDCSLLQSLSGYTRNKENLPCWWCRGSVRHRGRYAAPSLASFPRLNYLVFPEWPLPARLQLRAEVGLYWFIYSNFIFVPFPLLAIRNEFCSWLNQGNCEQALMPVHLEAVFKSWLISVLRCKADKSLKRRSQGCLQRPDVSFY